MNDIEIGIIGGTHGMGEWLARFLEAEKYVVHVSGRSAGMSMKEMAERCQVVVVSVPIGVTRATIEAVGPHMPEHSLLMDLTSLKKEPVEVMLESSISEVVGCHPLFGPRIESIEGQHVVLCPGRGERWFSWLREIFSRCGAMVVETTTENHDRMMAIVQGLNHFNTVAMGIALSRSGSTLAEVKSFSTPLFDTKLKVVERVFCQNPRLYAEILTMNPEIHTLIELYESAVTELKRLVQKGDASGVTEMIENHARFFNTV